MTLNMASPLRMKLKISPDAKLLAAAGKELHQEILASLTNV
jgi:hypothetical protein